MKNYCYRVFYRVIWNGRGDGEWGGEASFPQTKNHTTKTGICVLQPYTATSAQNHGHDQFKRLQEKHDSNAMVSMRVAVTKTKLRKHSVDAHDVTCSIAHPEG